MKICRFNKDRLGLVEDDTVIDVSEALARLPAVRWSYPPGDAIMAGTAASFAPIHPGSVMVADFAGIGRMEVATRVHR